MRNPTIAILLLVPLLAGAAPVAAQADDASLILLHDARPEDGRVLVGARANFGLALVDGTGAPLEHHDYHVTITQAGREVFATEDAHDYDGLWNVAFTFTEPGPYEVHAAALRGGDVVAEAAFAGVAVTPEAPLDAGITFEAPDALRAQVPAEFRVGVEDAATGAGVPHATMSVDFTRVADAKLVLRAHLHAHDAAPAAFRYAFPAPGEYEVTVNAWTAHPEPGRPEYASPAFTTRVTVGAPVPAADAARAVQTDAPATAPDADAPAGNYALFATTDPSPTAGSRIAGPDTLVHLNGFAFDQDAGDAAPHVDFETRVDGPWGLVFASEDAHEYNGHHALVVSGLPLGEYTFYVNAASTRNAWTARESVTFRVIPPLVALTAGPYAAHMDAPDEVPAGEAVDLAFTVSNAAGDPYRHTELDVTLLPEGDAPAFSNFKLHTHGDGAYAARVAFPEAGAWRVLVHASPLEPRPSFVLGPDGPGAPIAFDVDVRPGIVTDAGGVDATAEDGFRVPGPGLGAVIALAFLARGLRRR